MKSRHGGLAPKPRGTKVVRESCQLRVLSARRSNPGRSALPFRDHCYSRLHCKLDHGLASPFYPLVSSRPAQVATSSYLDWFLATRFLPSRKPPSIPFSLYFRYSYPPSFPRSCKETNRVAKIVHTTTRYRQFAWKLGKERKRIVFVEGQFT